MNNATKQELMALVDSLGNEIMYLTTAGQYQRAEQLKEEVEEIILTIQRL